jgi:hypothetical protein
MKTLEVFFFPDAGSIHYEGKWEGFPGPNPLPLA